MITFLQCLDFPEWSLTRGEEERRRKRRTGGSTLFLAMAGCFCPFLHLFFSSLFPPKSGPPRQAWCRLQGPGRTRHRVYLTVFSLYSWVKVYNHGSFSTLCCHWRCFVRWGVVDWVFKFGFISLEQASCHCSTGQVLHRLARADWKHTSYLPKWLQNWQT